MCTSHSPPKLSTCIQGRPLNLGRLSPRSSTLQAKAANCTSREVRPRLIVYRLTCIPARHQLLQLRWAIRTGPAERPWHIYLCIGRHVHRRMEK